jgi:hypothetical protein
VLDKIGPSLLVAALYALGGLGLQALLPAPLERSLAARLGFAYLLGVAWVGLLAWACGFALGAPIGAPLALALVSVPVVAGAVALARSRALRGLAPRATGERSGARWLAAAAALVFAATLALVAHSAAEPVHDFDGRMTWGTQARYLLDARSVVPPALVDADAFVVHPRYPILMPLVQALTADLAGASLDGYVVRPIYALFYPALVAALAPALVRAGGCRAAAWTIATLFAAPIVRLEREAGPFGTYSDFPLASFFGAGIAVLMHPCARREPWRGAVAGLLLAAAAGTKNEGAILALAAPAALGWIGGTGGPRRVLVSRLLAAAAVVLALVGIVTWKGRIPLRNEEPFLESASPLELARGLAERGPAVAARAVRMAVEPPWGFLFWIALPLAAAGWRGSRGRAPRAGLALVGCQLALAFAAYAVVSDVGIVSTTWNRFMIQASAPLALALAAVAGRVSAMARASTPVHR